MSKKDALKKLRQLGYARSEEFVPSVQRGTVPPQPTDLTDQNFKGEILNHTIMEYVTLQRCNYDEACVTGSIFRNCKFIDCSMDRADFEFCEFYHCEFIIKKIDGCSFNSSSFMDTIFGTVHFDCCTFTGALFQRCSFDRVQIEYSTLENALFKQCSFYHMDIRYLNMDYIDLDRPHMEDVVLPISQVSFIFGAPQYLKNTTDSVFIAKGNHGRMTPAVFFGEAVPLLCSHFTKTNQFFPLANLYFALGNCDEGTKAVEKGILASMAIRDFRMLKHFCKLAADSDAFPPRTLRRLYHNFICRLYPQYSAELDIPNYARHITEIKALLFSKAKRPSVSLSLKTDIQQGEHHKLGILAGRLFDMAKCRGAFQNDDIEVVLSYHSPLTVTVRASGDEDELAALLAAYLSLTGMPAEEMLELPVVADYQRRLPEQIEYRQELKAAAHDTYQEILALSIHVVLLEYYVENFQSYSSGSETVYYFNSSAVPKRGALPQNRG